MGILGLLQYLKNCRKEKHLSHYKGKTAAVDTYAWYQLSHTGYTRLSKAQLENSSSLEVLTDINMSTIVKNEEKK